MESINQKTLAWREHREEVEGMQYWNGILEGTRYQQKPFLSSLWVIRSGPAIAGGSSKQFNSPINLSQAPISVFSADGHLYKLFELPGIGQV